MWQIFELAVTIYSVTNEAAFADLLVLLRGKLFNVS